MTSSLASYLTPNCCLRIHSLIVPLEFTGQESEFQIELLCKFLANRYAFQHWYKICTCIGCICVWRL